MFNPIHIDSRAVASLWNLARAIPFGMGLRMVFLPGYMSSSSGIFLAQFGLGGLGQRFNYLQFILVISFAQASSISMHSEAGSYLLGQNLYNGTPEVLV